LRKENKMLKRSLIAIAVLAMFAGPVLAGEVKIYPVNYPEDQKGWPGHWTYNKVEVCRINLVMCIPYWIHIVDQEPIQLFQVGDEIHHWAGSKTTAVDCNFDALLSGYVLSDAVLGTDPAGAWTVTFDPACICSCGADTTITVDVTELDLHSLGGVGGQNDVLVGVLVVEVEPCV